MQAKKLYVKIDIMKLNSLHYVLLAGVNLSPSSGYDLTQWLAKPGQHYWAAEHSSIYPALQSLQKAGLLVLSGEPGLRGKPRKVYQLSEIGQEILRAWVNETSPMPVTRDEQMVKVLCFDLLTPDEIVSHLERIRLQHMVKLQYFEDLFSRRYAQPEKDCLSVGPTPLGPMLTLRKGILAAGSYVDWCEEALSLVRATE